MARQQAGQGKRPDGELVPLPEVRDGLHVMPDGSPVRVKGFIYESDLLPLPSLLLEVCLTARDGETVRKMSEDDYRTPAQQVGWIVSQWLKGYSPPAPPPAISTRPSSVTRNGATNAARTPTAPLIEASPNLIPIFHCGDGSAGSGCGKVGLLAARRLEGAILPGDVFHAGKLGGLPCHHEKPEGAIWSSDDGGLTCCQCGGVMTPASWSYADDGEPVRKSVSKATAARMEAPKA